MEPEQGREEGAGDNVDCCREVHLQTERHDSFSPSPLKLCTISTLMGNRPRKDTGVARLVPSHSGQIQTSPQIKARLVL